MCVDVCAITVLETALAALVFLFDAAHNYPRDIELFKYYVPTHIYTHTHIHEGSQTVLYILLSCTYAYKYTHARTHTHVSHFSGAPPEH